MGIPEDIMRAANEAVNGIKCFPPSDLSPLTISIARAILAERQRCTDVARRYLEDIAGCDMSDDEPDKIAAAVMDPKWEPPPL